MRSKIIKVYSYINLIFLLIILFLIRNEFVSNDWFLMGYWLIAIICNSIITSIVRNKIKKEYDMSFEDQSLTELSLHRKNIHEPSIPSDNTENLIIKKFYPKRKIIKNFTDSITIFIFYIVSLIILYLPLSEMPKGVYIIYGFVIGLLVFFTIIKFFFIMRKPLIIYNTGIKAHYKKDFDLSTNGTYKMLSFSDIAEINIKKNKYIYGNEIGVIFEIDLNDDRNILFYTHIYSDEQRDEIIQIIRRLL